MLTISAKAIHAVDPKAKIVSGGVVSKPFNDDLLAGARYLRRMFRSKAAARAADIVAIHPYTRTVRDAKEIIEQARKVMDRAGLKRTPIWVTEIGWGTRPGPAEPTGSGAEQASTGRRVANAGPRGWRRWSISAAEQRRNLRRSFEMVLRQRKKLGVRRMVWYQWQQGPDDACGWCQTSGLVRAERRRQAVAQGLQPHCPTSRFTGARRRSCPGSSGSPGRPGPASLPAGSR